MEWTEVFMVLTLTAWIGPSSVTAGNKCPQDLPCPCEQGAEDSNALYIKCNSLNLEEVPDLASSLGHTAIYSLDLVGNNIRTLRDYSFIGLNFYTSGQYPPGIYLGLNPLTEIQENAFANITAEVISLGIGSEQMTQFPLEQLRKLPNLSVFTLEGTQITELPDNLFDSHPKLSEIRIYDSKKLEVINDGAFLGLEDILKRLTIRNTGLNTFPSAPLGTLRRIKMIDLKDNKIETLESHILDGFPWRKTYDSFELYLDSNHIRNISVNAFSKKNTRTVIDKLSMQNNAIKDLNFLHDPCSLVFSLPARTRIYLNKNPIKCDCSVFSVLQTKMYTLQASCASPEDYENKRIDVSSTDDNSIVIYDDKSYEQLALRDCSQNMTIWDQSCAGWMQRKPGGPDGGSGNTSTSSAQRFNITSMSLLLLHTAIWFISSCLST